jgi:isopenicillin N synthase-like dioxygenase
VNEIPRVELDSRDAPARIRSAAVAIGFFQLVGHGVPGAMVEAARAAARSFFSLPPAVKNGARVDDLHRGYVGPEQARLSPDADTDFKESFVWGMDRPRDPLRPLVGRNRWPEACPELEAALEPWFKAVLRAGARLLQPFALALEMPEAYFLERYREPLARGSVLHYPPDSSRLRLGTSAHTDYGGLTFVAQDDVGGLQVETPSGHWVDVPPLTDALVVNVGDLMALWTDGRFRSTRHRVRSPRDRDRYSMAVFYDPSYDTVIEGSGTRVVCGEYIQRRFDDVFSYRRPRRSP